MTKLLCKLLLNKYKQSGGKKPTGEISITENGIHDVTNYASANVNVSGGGSVTENDVNFYDYDGTLVDSYTKNQFLALEEMPENPSHSGLTAQGWNWSLADAKDYVTECGKLDVGQMYVTDDNKTRLYITLEEGRLSPRLGLRVNGSVVVDWGDGNTETMTGTSTTTTIFKEHTYSSVGDYVIALDSSSTIYFNGTNNVPELLSKNNANNTNEHKVYLNCLKKVELGSNVVINNYVFLNYYNLETITLPKTITSISNYTFQNCQKLKYIVIPNRTTTIETFGFSYCIKLKGVSLPKSLISIGTYAFKLCYSLTKIIIPSSVTQISNYTFYQSYSLTSAILPSSVTKISQNGFNDCYNLKDIMINGVVTLSRYAFLNCYSLIKITLPNTLTTLDTGTFSNCYSLSKIKIPKTVTNITASLFNSCFGIKYFDFSKHTTVPTLADTSAFSNIALDAQIIVPDNLYEDWIVATNWSTYADYIVKESEYNAS